MKILKLLPLKEFKIFCQLGLNEYKYETFDNNYDINTCGNIMIIFDQL